MSGDYLHRLVAVPSAHAIRLKVAPIQCEHPSCAERVMSRKPNDPTTAHLFDRGSDLAAQATDDRRTQPLVALATMHPLPHPLRFVLVALAGWMNQQQRDVIDYLQEENRVLREQLGPRRLRFTDAQRRRLAAKAKILGRRFLRDIATIVTPDTLLAWHRTDRQEVRRERTSWSRTISRHDRDPNVDRAYGDGNRGWGCTRIQGDGEVKQGDHEVLHRRDSVGQTSGPTPRCLNPGF